ncbi:MAG TPA: isovaleryl-CoA dehydrogenase [Oligoflexus sp.]|uniref:isovaleryl-CoA dehydrogenase n=1 Tax=Oligoflexus sp. TaxID=1971216 RepID=UPI002D810EC4|nr:isovaleryl-CoA dehydrogenase [Oligoflexus sp.]HET9236553.1 isovaleryl-CoA dehydrogenase [Oligoflexus sp.]
MEAWQTHEVTNQSPALLDYNLYLQDHALREALQREGASWAAPQLEQWGAELGRAEAHDNGRLANEYPPVLKTFDARGHRVDQVEFHPAWHQLLHDVARRGLHTGPWSETRPSAHVARAAAYLLQTQVETGTLCPTTMTYGVIPVLRKGPTWVQSWLSTLYSKEHDPRDLPFSMKKGGLLGMGMTEKQGGSDVRSNSTEARRLNGDEYLLRGHKWFFSAPMCDAHLVLARSSSGLSCFFVPRWRPDGSKNAIHIQRLKHKLGNRSNASSEVEFHDAWAILLGEEGRGVPTIIEMGTYTRLDCAIGTAGLMRQGLSQALHHANHRQTFGKKLCHHPLMQNVLADLALESEAATALAMRLARAFDQQEDEAETIVRRLLTPAAKFWVCKRGCEFMEEAMEVLGGNGYCEDYNLPRMYREMPVNSIWEGSGNIMCLDVLRALQKNPRAMDVLAHEMQAGAAHPLLDRHRDGIMQRLKTETAQEAMARRLTQDLILGVQAALLLRHAPPYVAEAFCQSRLAHDWGYTYGSLGPTVHFSAILERAWPTRG